MKKLGFLLAAISTVVLVASGGARAVDPSAKRPNVVVFVADDLGWRDLGCTGTTFYESPNIDALAARGTIFNSAYSTCPVCSPTRASLLTGKYPQRVGITDYIGGPQPGAAAKQEKYKDRLLPAPYRTHLALEETTVAEAFEKAGYATFFAGKWHLGGKQYHPDKQGFDVAVGASAKGSPGQRGYFSPYNEHTGLTPGAEGEHLDIRLANETAKWTSSRTKDEPFLVWFSLYDVHTPLMAPPKTVEYFQAKREKLQLSDEFGDEGASKVRLTQAHVVYAAMVKTMDDAVGIVIKQLEAEKKLEHTVIVFTSDNGGLATAEGAPTSNLPLRAGKGWPYEGGVRVPLIVCAPHVSRAPRKSDVPAISTDLFPTLLAACGLAPQPDKHLDGANLLPALTGNVKDVPERPLFWHYPHYGNQGGVPFSAVRAGDWKLIAFHDARRGVELYNLTEDPAEKHSLAPQETARVEELRRVLEQWKTSVGAIDAKPRSDR